MNQKLLEKQLKYMGLSLEDKFDVKWGIMFSAYPAGVSLENSEIAKGYKLEDCINLIYDFIRSNLPGEFAKVVSFHLTHIDPSRGRINYHMTTKHLADYDSAFDPYVNKDVRVDHMIFIDELVSLKEETEEPKRNKKAWEGL